MPEIPVRLFFLLPSFVARGVGELALRVAPHIPRECFRIWVVSLGGGGTMQNEFRQAGLEAASLDGGAGLGVRIHYRLRRLLRSTGADLIHAHTFYANAAARLASGTTPVVTTCHGIDGWLPRKYRFLERRLVSRTAACIAVSAAVRDFYVGDVGISPERIHIVPNGIEPALFDIPMKRKEVRRAFGIPHERRILVSVGRLEGADRGFADAIEAAMRLRRQGMDVHLLIVGEGYGREDVETSIVEARASMCVTLAGERRDLPRILAGSDILVHPAHREGFGIALLEGMAAKLPVVATRVGGIPSVVVEGKTGLLVPPRDPEAMAGAVASLLEDPERAKAMGEAGRRRVESVFTADRTARSWMAVYEEVLGRVEPCRDPEAPDAKRQAPNDIQ